MTKQIINVGTAANDRKGDSLRAAFQKVNANFTELYTLTGADAAANQLVNGSHVVDLGSTGVLTFPDGLTLTGSILEKRLEETVEDITNAIGSKLTLTTSTISIEGYSDPDGPNNTNVGRVTATNGGVVIEVLTDIVGGTAGTSLLVSDGGLYLNTTDGVTDSTFAIGNGELVFPSGPKLRGQSQTTCLPGADTVIYTSTGVSAIKLFVMVEGIVDGGGAEVEMQSCEIIAVKGYNDNLVHVTTYGVTYSSAAAFATFDGQWNSGSSVMEITCQPTSLTNEIFVNVHAVEFNSNF